MVDFATIINKDDLAVLKDDHSCVGAHISNQTERTLYHLLRNAGHTVCVARRCRHWHLRNILGLIDIAHYQRELNQNERSK